MSGSALQETSGMATLEVPKEILAQVYDAIIDGQIPPEIGDPEITAKAIQRRIAAGSLEQSMSPRDSLEGLQELATNPFKLSNGRTGLVSEPIVIHGFHLNPSAFENEETGDRGAYAVVDATLTASGERDAYSCGGGNVLVQLVKALEERAYPLQAVVEVVPTGTPGRKTMWLRYPGEAS